jgi:2-polyprenyl-3-methyl-5-hydroxy-6-metoxy-1,4-benzoquinol methylase
MSVAAAGSAAELACPLCGGAGRHLMTMPIDAKTFRPTPHGNVHRCSACGFDYIAPRPTPAQTASFYDIGGYYTQGHDDTPRVGPPGFLSRLRSHIAWRCDRSQDPIDVISRRLAPGATILDIGCGDGSQLDLMAARGFRATGVERDTHSLALRSRGAQVVEGSAEALPPQLAHGSFDAALFKQVLEHLVDPVAALRNAAALLRPGGLLFVEVPNAHSAVARQSGLSWAHMDVPRHLNFFSVATLAAAVRAAGLAIDEVFFNEYCRYFSDEDIAADQRIHDQLGGAQPSRRNSSARAWALLLRTMFATPQAKYDCIGVVAKKK